MIDKKLIHFNTKDVFDQKKDQIKDTSIVFVKDSNEIYTHGEEYQWVGWSVLKNLNLICTYNITDVSSETKVCNSTSNFSLMIVDGIETAISTTYQFTTVGQHIVEFVLIDNTKIVLYALQDCNELSNVIIPDSVTNISIMAFGGCTGLTNINIPKNVTSIGGFAFNNCINLLNITVDSDNPVYDSRDNCNCIIETDTNKLIQGCSNSIIPNSITKIGAYSFSNYNDLLEITIPESVVEIDSYAFAYCENLTNITCNANTAPIVSQYTFYDIASNGVLNFPSGSDYSSWMSTDSYYLGYYGWTVDSESESGILEFTVKDTATNVVYGPFQFEEGMTSTEWYESEYRSDVIDSRTGGIGISVGGVVYLVMEWDQLIEAIEYTFDSNGSDWEPL